VPAAICTGGIVDAGHLERVGPAEEAMAGTAFEAGCGTGIWSRAEW